MTADNLLLVKKIKCSKIEWQNNMRIFLFRQTLHKGQILIFPALPPEINSTNFNEYEVSIIDLFWVQRSWIVPGNHLQEVFYRQAIRYQFCLALYEKYLRTRLRKSFETDAESSS